MKYLAEKTGKGKNGYAKVKKGDEEIAICYGHLENRRQGLTRINAEDDASTIADSLNLREELKQTTPSTTKEKLLSIINKYL
jgi:hypothetical protein